MAQVRGWEGQSCRLAQREQRIAGTARGRAASIAGPVVCPRGKFRWQHPRESWGQAVERLLSHPVWLQMQHGTPCPRKATTQAHLNDGGRLRQARGLNHDAVKLVAPLVLE